MLIHLPDFKRNRWALGLALLSVGALLSGAERPNVVIFLADDLGYADLSCYRGEGAAELDRPPTAQTPNIDRLATAGTRFTDFYCGAAVCSPSRAALLTGRNATRVGIYNWVPGNRPMHLRSEEVTLAELLVEQGYRAGHFGKWHLTSRLDEQPLPMDQGFEYAFYTQNNAEPSHRNPENFYRNGEAVGQLEGYACQLVVNEAIGWLEELSGGDEPFYLNVWFNEPHEKVAAPPELAQRHAYRSEYYGCIENMDLAVGRLMDYLEERGLSDNTLVIFTSDNGSQVHSSNHPLRSEKCFNFEGGVRVPFIAHWPAGVPAGKLNASVGGFVDVVPTLAAKLDLALPRERKLDGVDLGRALFAGKEARRENPMFFFRYFHDPVCMLREGRYVLLGFEEPMPYQQSYGAREEANLKPGPGEPPWANWGFQEGHMEYLKDCVPTHFELYDVASDPDQSEDIAEEHPRRAQRMKKAMLALREEMIAEGGDWYGE